MGRRLENDANEGALAEWLFGAGRGTRNMVFCTFGTGFCSGGGIAQLAHAYAVERLQRGERVGFCRSLAEAGSVTAREVGEAAEKGDAAARELLAAVGRRLGQALAILVDVLNPERIVLGSIFARQHAFIWPECERVLREEALAPALAVCRVVPAELGERIGDLAALAVAMEAGREERTTP